MGAMYAPHGTPNENLKLANPNPNPKPNNYPSSFPSLNHNPTPRHPQTCAVATVTTAQCIAANYKQAVQGVNSSLCVCSVCMLLVVVGLF